MSTLPIVIHDRTEGKRGCGYRKAGGKYLVLLDGLGRPCGKLPIPLTVCPCCSQGIKPSRGWTWVDADRLSKDYECAQAPACVKCPLGALMGRAGLLWIGEKFYATPGDFTAEAIQMGISRRLHQVPRDFVLGTTWVLVAHRKTIEKQCPSCLASGAMMPRPLCDECEGRGFIHTPGVFHAFKPSAIEYVLTEKESEEELRDLMKRGFTLVRVKRDDGRALGEPTEEDEE